jgi:cell wall-active antibiotic response 4TMS protein YvqF
MNPTPRGTVITPRLIFGLFVLLAGALLAADRFGWIESRAIFHYWPLALIAIGLAKLLQPHGGRGGGWVLLFLGIFFFAREMDWTDLDFSDLLPFALVALGLSLVFTSLARRGRVQRALGPDGTPVAAASDWIDAFAMLGGTRHASSAPDFRGGSATAIAGGCEIDLRQAAIDGGEAVIDVFAFWGGIEILVPESWSVSLRGTPLLGAIENNTRQPEGGSTQRLVVKGMAVMGGVEVKNNKGRE